MENLNGELGLEYEEDFETTLSSQFNFNRSSLSHSGIHSILN